MQTEVNILLTGGTGFFGRSLLRHWLSSYERKLEIPRVTVLSRAPKRFLSQFEIFNDLPWLRFHAGDITDSDTFPHDQFFTHVIHAATDSTVGPMLHPMERFDQIYSGTRNLLNYAVVTGVSRFLLTSSGGVYGPQPFSMGRIPESYHGIPDPLDPASAYSMGKRAAEHLCSLYQSKFGIDVVVARCFAFVGQDLPLNAHFAIGNFIRDALTQVEIRVQGDGTPYRSYLDQRDLAAWLIKLLLHGRSGRAYNVGSDQEISISSLAHLVRDIIAPGKNVVIMQSPNSGRLPSRYIPDIGRAKSELGLKVNFSLSDAIRNAAYSCDFANRLQGSSHPDTE